MSTRSRLTAVAAAVAALVGAPAAQAATDNTSVTLGPGTLDYTTPFSAGDFPNTTLNGWNVTVSASQFSTGGGSPSTLPTGSMTLATVPVPTTTLGNVSLPPIPVPLTSAIDGGSTQKMATAALAQGLGQWTFTSLNAGGGDLLLTVPPSALAGTYTSTITTTLATGP
jgi:hypothetical protein